MAARIIEDGKKFVRLSYGEATLAGACTLALGALTFAFSAGAQVNALKTELAGKAGRFIVDSIGREVAKKADASRMETIDGRLAQLERDSRTVICILAPSDLRCRR